MTAADHKREAEDWLDVAEDAVAKVDGGPYPHELVQSAALMAIAHTLAAMLPDPAPAEDEHRWINVSGIEDLPNSQYLCNHCGQREWRDHLGRVLDG